jgi:TPR repeat protein
MPDNDLFARANEEWDSGNLHEAFELFSKAAAHGHASAQNSLGYFYDHGIAVRKDRTKAMSWYRKAARHGDVPAYNNLAITYRDGGNVKQAKFWFGKALKKGDGDAALELAKLALDGRRETLEQALRLVTIAAASNYILSDSKNEAKELAKKLKDILAWIKRRP